MATEDDTFRILSRADVNHELFFKLWEGHPSDELLVIRIHGVGWKILEFFRAVNRYFRTELREYDLYNLDASDMDNTVSRLLLVEEELYGNRR